MLFGLGFLFPLMYLPPPATLMWWYRHCTSRVSDPVTGFPICIFHVFVFGEGDLYVVVQARWCRFWYWLKCIVYIFIGSILLHNGMLRIVAGSMICVVGLTYCEWISDGRAYEILTMRSCARVCTIYWATGEYEGFSVGWRAGLNWDASVCSTKY